MLPSVVVLRTVVMLPNVVMLLGVRGWWEVYEAGCCVAISIGAGSQGGQGTIMIDDVEDLRLDVIDLAIDCGNRRGRGGIDAAHQRGFLTQERDGVVESVEIMAGDPLIDNGVL